MSYDRIDRAFKVYFIVLILILTITVIFSIIIYLDFSQEGEEFCRERGMVHTMDSLGGFRGACLKIDEFNKVVETYRVVKINGEYYLE